MFDVYRLTKIVKKHIYIKQNQQSFYINMFYNFYKGINKQILLKNFFNLNSRFFSVQTDNYIHPEAHVVIGGGGLFGCSLAYHLATAGLTNVIVIDKGKFGGGSSWMSSGVVSQLRPTLTEIELVHHSHILYRKLDQQGYDIGWKMNGSMNLSRSKDRTTALKRLLLLAQFFDVEGKEMNRDEIKASYPFLNTVDLKEGIFVESDAVVDPMKLLKTFLELSKQKGVKFVENCEIKKVEVKKRRVTSVATNRGSVICDHFVNCTGQHARQLGKLTEPYGVNIPVHSSQFSEMLTEPLGHIKDISNVPFFRDYDGFIYFQNYQDRLVAGGFPPLSKPLFHNGIPDDYHFKYLEEDWDSYHVLLEELLVRLPWLHGAKASILRTCSDSFTPDGKPILGPVPELHNYYVATGTNCSICSLAGGVGKVMAEWIMNGHPVGINLWPVDVRRFVGLHNNRKFLRERVSESAGILAMMPYWEMDMVGWDYGRKLRTSSVFTRNEHSAVFGQIMGYERPLFFHTQDAELDGGEGEIGTNVWAMNSFNSTLHGVQTHFPNQGSTHPSKGSFGKPLWFDRVKSEYWACREGVCLIDMSTFSKFEIRSAGNEVVKYLQYICSNDVDKPVGSVIHTGMQNERGGYENDCSMIRVSNNRYFMIGPTVQQTRAFTWMVSHLPKDGSVQLNDLTSMYTAINVIGPKAQELLSELTDRSLKKKDFMFMTQKEINVAMASHVRAMRLTHTGEDGWVLYVPSEFGLHVYDTLQYHGRNYGLRNAGYYALRTLRMEKFFALWGTDLSDQDTPFECGREFRVKMKTGGFIGHKALEKQKKEGIKKRMVLILVEEFDPIVDSWPWVGEPLYRNGKRCGITTSATYSFGFEKPVCYGFIQNIDEASKEAHFITNEFISKNAKYEINIGGKMHPAKIHLHAPVLPPTNR